MDKGFLELVDRYGHPKFAKRWQVDRVMIHESENRSAKLWRYAWALAHGEETFIPGLWTYSRFERRTLGDALAFYQGQQRIHQDRPSDATLEVINAFRRMSPPGMSYRLSRRGCGVVIVMTACGRQEGCDG